MATERDAADVAITNVFGTAWLSNFTVVTDEVRAVTLDFGNFATEERSF